MRVFVGGASGKIQEEPCDLSGDRCFSAYYPPSKDGIRVIDPSSLNALLDSGAFQNVKEGTRLTFDQALERQLNYERYMRRRYEAWQNWRAYALVTYDLLIDEKWVNGRKVKERWDESDAWAAVEETVAAAQYFNRNRSTISPRIPVMACQGVTASQYRLCVEEVLKSCKPGDWLGLGGWCILGMKRSWLPTFEQVLLNCIPLIAQSPVNHVHIFGVMWLPAVAKLQWVCDQYGLSCSTDSQKPLKDCRWKRPEDRRKGGVRREYWRDNVEWWKKALSNEKLRQHPAYRSPTQLQLDLWSA